MTSKGGGRVLFSVCDSGVGFGLAGTDGWTYGQPGLLLVFVGVDWNGFPEWRAWDPDLLAQSVGRTEVEVLIRIFGP